MLHGTFLKRKRRIVRLDVHRSREIVRPDGVDVVLVGISGIRRTFLQSAVANSNVVSPGMSTGGADRINKIDILVMAAVDCRKRDAASNQPRRHVHAWKFI